MDWNEEHKHHFESLKKEVTDRSFLYFPDNSMPIYLATDCSETFHAALLYQVKSYTQEDVEQLKEQLADFPPSSIPTKHPVLPKAGKQVPNAFKLQPDNESQGQITHKLAAINRTGRDLTQIVNDPDTVHQVRVLGLFSGTFQGPAQNYTILEKESVAMLLAIEHFKDFLTMNNKVFVVSDCQAFLWLLRLRQLGISKVQRMCVRLCSYSFKIIVSHIPGANNPVDLLTRVHKKQQFVCVPRRQSRLRSCELHSRKETSSASRTFSASF